MKNNITYLAFFVIYFFAINSYSQSTENLKQKKLIIEKEISYTNQLLEKVEKDKKKSVNYLKVLQKQIKNQNNLLATLDKEFKLIDRQIIKIKEKINITKTDIENEENRLKRLKEEYAKMIYNMHINKAGRTDLIFIVSSESFNQAYKRLAYLKQYTTFRKNQTQKIQETKDFLKLKGENLLKEESSLFNASVDKNKVIISKTEELKLLNKIQTEKKDISKELIKSEKKIKKELKEKEKLMALLDEEIRRVIEEEIKKLRLEGKDKAYGLTPEAKILSNEFVSNRGNLPWPLTTGIIVNYFGKQKHEVFSGVETFNNGIDIATDKDAIIRAVFDGVISRIFFIKGVGKAILINHGEYYTVYSGVKDVLVKVNDKILAKEKIGVVETKYPEEKTELHFEIWKNYEKMNPSKWLYNEY
jgi:septal ring factor EnvC (AmiA/AmiB activator)